MRPFEFIKDVVGWIIFFHILKGFCFGESLQYLICLLENVIVINNKVLSVRKLRKREIDDEENSFDRIIINQMIMKNYQNISLHMNIKLNFANLSFKGT